MEHEKSSRLGQEIFSATRKDEAVPESFKRRESPLNLADDVVD
jgi:hypothetical protein